MCAEVLTPGWLIRLKVQDELYEVHTDRSGERLRWQTDDAHGPG
jgi:hypothetical protein